MLLAFGLIFDATLIFFFNFDRNVLVVVATDTIFDFIRRGKKQKQPSVKESLNQNNAKNCTKHLAQDISSELLIKFLLKYVNI